MTHYPGSIAGFTSEYNEVMKSAFIFKYYGESDLDVKEINLTPSRGVYDGNNFLRISHEWINAPYNVTTGIPDALKKMNFKDFKYSFSLFPPFLFLITF